jgi:hypothetical protein
VKPDRQDLSLRYARAFTECAGEPLITKFILRGDFSYRYVADNSNLKRLLLWKKSVLARVKRRILPGFFPYGIGFTNNFEKTGWTYGFRKSEKHSKAPRSVVEKDAFFSQKTYTFLVE